MTRNPTLWLLCFLPGLLVGAYGASAGTGGLPGPGSNCRDCLSCHEGIERTGPGHSMTCLECHLPPKDHVGRGPILHETLVRNPSDPVHAKTFCLPCHEGEVRRLDRSLHTTMAGIINQTRYLWGAQEQAAPAVYGLGDPFRPLPEPSWATLPEGPKDLVDDFLRRRCLRCHIHTQGPQGPGAYRATGCAACHCLYGPEGRYEGADKAIDRGKRGFPRRHTLTRDIPNSQCLLCHRENHVGGDFEGLFERDYSRTFRPRPQEGAPEAFAGDRAHHRLARDIHRERGMQCRDCHGKAEVMGDGTPHASSLEVRRIACLDCHGRDTPGRVQGLERKPSGATLQGRDKSIRPVPVYDTEGSAHRIPAHAGVRCSACHAQWSYQDYGLEVIREDVLSEERRTRLSMWGDPCVQEFLETLGPGDVRGSVLSRDWVSGTERLGLWSMGWRFRRWEDMPLGKDPKGLFTLLRPRHQYRITYVDRLGQVLLDGVVPSRGDGTGPGWAFMPTSPHTLSPVGRACDACHRNPVGAGRGVSLGTSPDLLLTLPSPPALPGMGLLSEGESQALMNPSRAWAEARFLALGASRGPPRRPSAVDRVLP